MGVNKRGDDDDDDDDDVFVFRRRSSVYVFMHVCVLFYLFQTTTLSNIYVCMLYIYA